MGHSMLLLQPGASHCHHRDLYFSSAPLVPVTTSREHLLKSVLPLGCSNGGSPSRGSSPFGELSFLQLLEASMDWSHCRGATCTYDGDSRRSMDRVFFHGDGFGLVCLPGAIFCTKMAPSRAEEPVPGLYRDH